ncbi:MAG: Flp pilus assembly complex ATPase component TadA [Candidatus Omnitrophica bacterium]|nr:Flp pilus assembly complex ATPase component TadA [Candidatus Omnitrophota bacterium]
MVKRLHEKLIDILKNSNAVSAKDLSDVINIQKKQGGNLAKMLVEKGLITQKDLAALLSSEFNIPVLNLSRLKIDSGVVKLIPEKMARQYTLIPISKIGNSLTVCMADPLNIFAIDDIKALTSFDIDPTISTEKEITEAINNYYSTEMSQLSDILEQANTPDDADSVEVSRVEDETTVNIEEAAQLSKIPPIVKIVNLMLGEAIEKRASDIHIEPQENKLRVRYRVDGTAHEAFNLPKKDQNAILTRLKIMSGLDITQWRLPQDGRFRIKIRDKTVDFRVSVLPITHGGKIVLRLLDKSSLNIGLEKLGFSSDTLKLFDEAISRPYGMILMTGPTGSGKSTTLYSILTRLNTTDKNIVTIEDPVEYQIEGVTQMQVNADINLTFASGLRSVLRQSPDIVLIGEIRDFETADIAIKASLTGQLLLSTLHTNNAIGAIARLIDMGVEPFLVASSLIAVAAQRLARKICPHCKEPAEIRPAVLDRLNIKSELKKSMHIYRGKGCDKCNNTGYYGRMAIAEIFLVDDQVKQMIISRASEDKIKEYLVSKKNIRFLRDNAIFEWLAGQTTLEEVLRITTEE